MSWSQPNNQHLVTCPEIQGNKIYSSPRDQSLSDLLYSKTKRKQIFKKHAEIKVTTSGHLQLHALIMCNSQHFAGTSNNELFPV